MMAIGTGVIMIPPWFSKLCAALHYKSLAAGAGDNLMAKAIKRVAKKKSKSGLRKKTK
jgi:hypothetical protein